MLDHLLTTLGNVHRRRILTRLAEDEPITLDEVVRPADPDEASTLGLVLFHIHLPRLDDLDLIEWDADADLIRRGPRFAEVEPLVELLQSNREDLPGTWS